MMFRLFKDQPKGLLFAFSQSWDITSASDGTNSSYSREEGPSTQKLHPIMPLSTEDKMFVNSWGNSEPRQILIHWFQCQHSNGLNGIGTLSHSVSFKDSLYLGYTVCIFVILGNLYSCKELVLTKIKRIMVDVSMNYVLQRITSVKADGIPLRTSRNPLGLLGCFCFLYEV